MSERDAWLPGFELPTYPLQPNSTLDAECESGISGVDFSVPSINHNPAAVRLNRVSTERWPDIPRCQLQILAPMNQEE